MKRCPHTEILVPIAVFISLVCSVKCDIHHGNADIIEFDKPLDTIIIDDVIWLSILILIVCAFAWLCCFGVAAPTTPPTTTHCHKCCCDRRIHVRIERSDCVEDKKDEASANLNDYGLDHYPSAPIEEGTIVKP
jgi:hypothetical protein